MTTPLPTLPSARLIWCCLPILLAANACDVTEPPLPIGQPPTDRDAVWSPDGQQLVAGTRGYLRRATGELVCLDLPGAILTFPTGINDHGTIIGHRHREDRRDHGFAWSDGQWKTFDMPAALEISPDAINNHGDIAGRAILGDSTAVGFVRRINGFYLIRYPGAVRTVARGINDQGDIVGPYTTSDGVVRGFLLRR